ncbi:ParA family protein [Vibrio fluvialis]|nr:ParA family protein [Vibrio fluvialis]
MNKQQVLEVLRGNIANYRNLEDASQTAKKRLKFKEPVFTKMQLAAVLEVDSSDINEYMDNIIAKSDEPVRFSKDARGWSVITLEQAFMIAEEAGMVPVPTQRQQRNKHYDTPVTLVNTSKGGIGKSTTAIHLAVQSALDVTKNQRVLLIDTDPQGSIIHHIAQTDIESSFDSVATLIEENARLSRAERLSPENQAKFRKYIIENVLCDTYLANLKVLPSNMTDTELDLTITETILNNNGGIDSAITLYNDIVIEPMKTEFDSIWIDTTPTPNLTVCNLYYAANHVMFITSGRKLDYSAYVSHQSFLIKMIDQLMPEDFKGYHSMKTVITKHVALKRTNKQSVMLDRNVSKISSTNDTYSTRILENPRYELASDERLPLQLLDTANDALYKDAMALLNQLYNEVKHNCDKHLWAAA